MREIGRRLQTGLTWNRCVSTTYDVSPRVRSNRSWIKQIYARTVGIVGHQTMLAVAVKQRRR